MAEKTAYFNKTIKESIVNDFNKTYDISKEKNGSKYKFQRTLLEEMIEEYINRRCFDNYFIELKEPVYFDNSKLINNGTTECTSNVEDLIHDDNCEFEDIIMVTKIANNLDTWSKEYNTYCSQRGFDFHKGIIPYYNGKIKPALETIPPTGDEVYGKGLSLIEVDYNKNLNLVKMKYHENINDFKIFDPPEHVINLMNDTINDLEDKLNDENKEEIFTYYFYEDVYKFSKRDCFNKYNNPNGLRYYMEESDKKYRKKYQKVLKDNRKRNRKRFER